MTAFLFQSALLMLVAYFGGAFVGCIVRRTYFAHTLVPAVARASATSQPPAHQAPAAQAPANMAPQPAAAPVTRFERALTGAPSAPAVQPSAAPAPVAPVPVASPPSTAAPAPIVPAPAVAAASAAAAAAMAAVANARAAASAAPNLPTAMGTSGPASVTAPIAHAPVAPPVPTPTLAPAPVAAPAPSVAAKPASQDLTRIRAIDEQQQKQLNALGIGSYADIAAWRPEDVARISAALKIPGRIEQENWIEQAQILAKGGETYYSRRKLKGELPSARPTPDEGDRITVRVPATTRPADAPAAAAVSPPAPTQPAAPVDLKAAAAAAAAAVQAAQASVANGVKAVAAAAAPAAPAPVAPAPAAPAPAPVASAPAAPAPVVAVSAAAVAASAAASAAAAAVSAAGGKPIGMARDALQRIAGINGEVERLLNVQGVTSYAQIAGWNAGDVARFDRLLGFEGRIARENWIEQAQILSKGGETAYSREVARRATETPRVVPAAAAAPPGSAPARPEADRAAPREDLSALRSVRSEAYRATDVAAGPGPGQSRAPDDLKRIRGVGVLIEKKLNALGVSRYDQVANWSAADIERFSEKLDFKGRIERENWVEQARILSAGGQTEFSQRVDRGEVETSKLLENKPKT